MDIKLGSAAGGIKGYLHLRNDSLAWESKEGGQKVKIKGADVEAADWYRGGKTFHFKVRQSDGSVTRFEGFSSDDKNKMKEFCKNNINVEMGTISFDVHGRNTGKLDVVGDELIFQVDNKRCFDVSLADVALSEVTAQKDEIRLQFAEQEGASKKQDCLLEMRFYVPNTEDMEEDETDDPPKKSVELLNEKLKKHIALEAAGDQIIKLDNVKCRYPRATFEIFMSANSFKLHGQTYDFTVKYKHVQKILMVPTFGGHPGHYLVLSLDPPLRKGQTMYEHLVLFFDETDEDDEIELKLPSDFNQRVKDVDPKIRDKVTPVMRGQIQDLVANLFRCFCSIPNRNLKVHKKGKYTSVHDPEAPSVKCSIGANLGALYMLDNAFLFLEKPPMVFMYEEVTSIQFERNKKQLTSATSFDFKIRMTNGKTQDFNLIPKKELKNLEEWFSAVSKQKFDQRKMKIANYASDDEEDEGGMHLGDDVDHIANRVQADAEDDDDESSEDEDFDGAGASGSESSDEISEDSDGEGGDDEKPKKKKKGEKGASKEKVEKKDKRAKKDPNAPKKSKSAWLLFCDAKRAEVKAKNPDMKMTELAGPLSEMWKALSEEDKKPYLEEAAVLAEQYKKVKKQYDIDNPQPKKKRKGGDDDDEESSPRKKPKKEKDPNAPKKAMSAYMLWSNATREKLRADNPEMVMKDIMKELGVKWKELGDAEKSEWEGKAKEDKERYAKEMKDYKPKGPSVEEFAAKAEDSDSGSSSSSSGSDDD